MKPRDFMPGKIQDLISFMLQLVRLTKKLPAQDDSKEKGLNIKDVTLSSPKEPKGAYAQRRVSNHKSLVSRATFEIPRDSLRPLPNARNTRDDNKESVIPAKAGIRNFLKALHFVRDQDSQPTFAPACWQAGSAAITSISN